uniref:Bromodomain adjacent to zinc finger domain, 2A n=1 Tax=Sphaeramia orbicularis TaxID=375764 RepID=A0A673C469_9TELE
MEANNHFNYGTHSSANSGLKLSSGDSLYTNGSSMSFPQQGKNMNGELNVNGVTTVLGSGVSGSHPPTAPYPHMSNHHQSNMGYDYLWGGHPQYGPAMSTSAGQGMHQKQPSPGMGQPQSQHHYQGRGQYQLNGSIEGSHQPPVAGPPNMPLSGGQYWNRSNPGPQQMNYNSHMYGTYQSQAHPGITQSQHHQQQSLQPPPHQQSQSHLHSHRHPHHHHQQPQHYGMMPNGMPYYQHQPQRPSLPSTQQQPPPQQQSQPQGQAQMMPPTSQNFTPPRGSPQHHSLGRGGTGSPLPVGMSPAPMISPSSVQESGSPQHHNREKSPHSSNVGVAIVLQEPAANAPPQAMSPQLPASASNAAAPMPLTKVSTPPQASSTSVVSGSPISAPVLPGVSVCDVEVTPKQISTPSTVSNAPSPAVPPRLSSPPLMVQGLRPLPAAVTEISTTGPTSAGSPSSSVAASSPVKPSFAPQNKAAFPPTACGPPTTVSTSVTTSYSVSMPMSTPKQMVQESQGPPMTAEFPDTPDIEHNKSIAPALTIRSAFTTSVSSNVSSVTDVPSPISSSSGPSASAPSNSTASIASSASGEMNLASLAARESSTARPLSTLPLLTTQASRTAPVSIPPASMSVLPTKCTTSGVIQNFHSEHPPPNVTPIHGQKQLSPKPEHSDDRKELAKTEAGKADKTLPHLDSGTVKTPQNIEATETPKSEMLSPKSLTNVPGKPSPSPSAPHHKPDNKQTHEEVEHLTDNESFDSSYQLDGSLLYNKSSRIDNSSFLEKTTGLGGDGSYVDEFTHSDNSSHLGEDTSQFVSTSNAEDEPSIMFDNTRDSSSSVEDSRDDTLDSTDVGETSDAKESFQTMGESMLESSQNNTSKMEEPSISDVSTSQSYGSMQQTILSHLHSDEPGCAYFLTGESNRRRVATEEQVQFPLLHGWRREIRVKKTENRMKGETWYYTPCGRRMKQFPEIVKYLKKHQDSVVTRENFSFSPRMPVGDFYEERETSEGVSWVLLANEEVPSMIMAITGRRGRPPNPDKEKPRRVRGLREGQARRPGRPPKLKMIDLLSKVDAKLLKRLEAKEALTEEEKEKLAKIKKKMKRKLEQQARSLGANFSTDQQNLSLIASAAQPKKPGRRKSVKVEAPPVIQQTDEERIAQGKRVLGARSKAKALAKAQAEAAAAAQAALAAKRAAERRAQAQRRLEERKRQQMIAEELKKPAEDMCLTDHKLLPELSRIPGVVLSGTAFSHCLAVVEFLHGYGKIIGLNVPKDIPSLATLQEGLLGLGDSQGEVQDLLIKLVEAALHDPGLPSYYQSVKILGDKLVELELTRSTVSEVLRIFLESHGYETEVCNTLRTKTFHALPPDTKAAILGFLVEELNSSNIVTSDIDNTLENMATYRKNKWIIEGKLRKLKAALARRTGRSEEELCFEERRRSARVAEEENLNLEESGLIVERGNRRARKEEPKLSDCHTTLNTVLFRQAFFRKKLLQSSHSMRAILLGQDRYRRRYLALPHLGGVLVEGPEELLTSGDVLVAEVPVTFLKKEPKSEETLIPTSPPPTLPSSPSSVIPSQTLSPDEDPLPGTASLMSRPRVRGRPRKIKPEVELHLRTAKIRRRRRSSVRSGGEDGPGSPNSGSQDLTQAAFQNWLSQSQDALTNGTNSAAGDAPEGNRPEESVKEMAEKQGQWFNLLPKQPCDENSLSEPQDTASPAPAPSVSDCAPNLLPEAPPLLPVAVVAAPPPVAAPITTAPAPATPARPGRRRRRGSRGSSPARRGPRGAAAKRRGRPPNSVFQELEQQYFTQLVVKPIPASMVRGWWWIKDPEELYNTLQALHPRGIRERVLHKHLAKHMESLAEMCTRTINDPLFELKVEEKDVLMEALQQPWQVQEKAMETDISALQWVEDLEQRVIAADLHLKAPPQSALNDAESTTDTPMAEFQPYTIPDPDSTRDDLQYYEHDADPRDDWIVRTKKEWSGLPRIATHPLDLGVLRLANLERNIERRYLKEPLWNPAEVMRLAPLTPTPGEEHPMDVISLESEITSRLRTWRQALDRCRSAPQLCLCLLQLEKAIAWERSVTKVTCQVCRKGDNDECLLLCDGCDRGCHMYCLRPKITQVPEGDWFCPTCVAKEEVESTHSHRSSKKRTRTKKRRYEDDSSDDEAATTTTSTTTTRRSGGMTTRHKEITPSSSVSRFSGEGGGTKRRRMMTRNQPDLTFCEIILMEMEAHTDAWPFLEPVNPRLVPGYRRIIKNPMDFLTMRERLLQGGYCSCEEFAADAQLVFNNCELFNEDTSEVGMAGHSMRRFFESRWAEFYSNKDK